MNHDRAAQYIPVRIGERNLETGELRVFEAERQANGVSQSGELNLKNLGCNYSNIVGLPRHR
jgi:hypothetical protein